MQKLYIIRHGQSVANEKQVIAGSHNSPLSETGKLQASIAGENAKRFFHLDLIVSSPVDRALETAQIIAEKMSYNPKDIFIIPELSERHMGDVEGKKYTDIPEFLATGDVESVPGLEPLQDFYNRLEIAVTKIKALHEKNILIVCHNGSGRMLQAVLHGLSPQALYAQARLSNAIIYTI